VLGTLPCDVITSFFLPIIDTNILSSLHSVLDIIYGCFYVVKLSRYILLQCDINKSNAVYCSLFFIFTLRIIRL